MTLHCTTLTCLDPGDASPATRTSDAAGVTGRVNNRASERLLPEVQGWS